MILASHIFAVSLDGTRGFNGEESLKRSSVRFDSTGILKCLAVSFDEMGKMYHLVAFSVRSLGLKLIR